MKPLVLHGRCAAVEATHNCETAPKAVPEPYEGEQTPARVAGTSSWSGGRLGARRCLRQPTHELPWFLYAVPVQMLTHGREGHG